MLKLASPLARALSKLSRVSDDSLLNIIEEGTTRGLLVV